jgi:hypothetical protein
MQELKFKPLWVVTIQLTNPFFTSNPIQWGAFKYKKDAIQYANEIGGIVQKQKQRLLTNKY